MAVPVTPGPTFAPGESRRLFALGAGLFGSTIVPYDDLTPDDKRFVTVPLAAVRTTTINNLGPPWSPDGGSLAHNCPVEGVVNYCVTTLGPDKTSAVSTRQYVYPVSAQAPRIAVGFGVSPSWRPDGAFLAGFDGSTFFLVPPGGGDPRPLSAPPQGFDVDYLRWFADGRTLYASGSYPDRRYSILAVPGDGGPPREVVRSEGPAEQTFRFSFDIHGNTAYISLADRQSDIWTAEVETGP